MRSDGFKISKTISGLAVQEFLTLNPRDSMDCRMQSPSESPQSLFNRKSYISNTQNPVFVSPQGPMNENTAISVFSKLLIVFLPHSVSVVSSLIAYQILHEIRVMSCILVSHFRVLGVLPLQRLQHIVRMQVAFTLYELVRDVLHVRNHASKSTSVPVAGVRKAAMRAGALDSDLQRERLSVYYCLKGWNVGLSKNPYPIFLLALWFESLHLCRESHFEIYTIIYAVFLDDLEQLRQTSCCHSLNSSRRNHVKPLT